MERSFNIGKFVLAAIGALVLLAGCASTKPFLGFIATTGYVQQKMQVQSEANQKSLDKIDADLQQLQAEVSKFKDQSAQIKQLMDELEKTMSQTKQLEGLAVAVQEKIASLPRDTLLQLAALIQQQLGSSKPSSSSAK